MGLLLERLACPQKVDVYFCGWWGGAWEHKGPFEGMKSNFVGPNADSAVVLADVVLRSLAHAPRKLARQGDLHLFHVIADNAN